MLLPVNLNVRDRLCVLVGGGPVARRKCRTLVDHGARVRVVAPGLAGDGIWDSPGVEWIQGYYEPGTLDGAFLVIAATNDAEVNRRVEKDARELPALVLRADSAEHSDVTFAATLRRGSLPVSFATDGTDPALAAAVPPKAAVVQDKRPAAGEPEATEVLLIRHGEIEEQYRGRYVGRMDPPLSTMGIEHAVALRRHAELVGVEGCLTSPSLRARQTAAAAGLDAEIDGDLREIDFGRWEGLSFSEIAATDPEAVERWARLDPDFRFPDGESLAEFRERVRRVAQRIEAGPPRRICVFTHGGVIRALLCHWLELPQEAHLLLDVRPASLTRIRLFGSRGTLCGFNDLCHTAEVIR